MTGIHFNTEQSENPELCENEIRNSHFITYKKLPIIQTDKLERIHCKTKRLVKRGKKNYEYMTEASKSNLKKFY